MDYCKDKLNDFIATNFSELEFFCQECLKSCHTYTIVHCLIAMALIINDIITMMRCTLPPSILRYPNIDTNAALSFKIPGAYLYLFLYGLVLASIYLKNPEFMATYIIIQAFNIVLSTITTAMNIVLRWNKCTPILILSYAFMVFNWVQYLCTYRSLLCQCS